MDGSELLAWFSQPPNFHKTGQLTKEVKCVAFTLHSLMPIFSATTVTFKQEFGGGQRAGRAAGLLAPSLSTLCCFSHGRSQMLPG